MVTSWKARVRRLKRLLHALGFAYRDPRTPRLARILIACVIAYALSPIDLIPDIIPILGYLDDLILLPLGIVMAVRLVPGDVWREAQHRATVAPNDGSTLGRVGAIVIVVLWLVLAVAGILLVRSRL